MNHDLAQNAHERPRKERSTFGSLRLRGRIWWLRYRVDSKEHWESSRSSSRRVAEKLLERRAAQFDDGRLTPPSARRVRFSDLEALLLTNYRNVGRRSLPRAMRAIAHLREAFDATRAAAITVDAITSYETDRLEAGAARATVMYELAILRRMFVLAVKAGKLTTRPGISTPEVHNERTGFFEADDFAAVLKELPVPLRPVMTFAYFTGWRVRSEVLPLTWDRVDLVNGVIRLEPNTTKSGAARTFPFSALPELVTLIAERRATTQAMERSAGRIIPYVFHRDGQPIKSYHHAWERACRLAARGGSSEPLAEVVRPQLVGRIVHDFRRTAVRNLVRAGVPERVAMDLTGHKTRKVFDRYNITNEADLRAGVAKLATHLTGDAPVAESKPRRTSKGTKGGQSGRRASGESA